ncbi:TNT domain-containing protein [Micromonospora cathayae]|uniref:TNT domain-containing protein n=1 Tax=Micromonospora cathayae TaxID=3028804 RepID=A0ABY7ZVM1_9ACTN|nr:TNT domain-containing protein [Micromonospora sp. HUAS 3]WDZ86172.1 TNT domain-containing protein [Micromonospora sp. HUAS 3]
MKLNRRLLALLAGATLVLLPLPAQSVLAGSAQAVPTRSGGPADVDHDQRTRPADTGPSTGRPPAQQAGQLPIQRPGGSGSVTGSLCRPGVPPNAPPTTAYYDNNPLLGPAQLPTASPVGPLLAGYQRFGALTEQEFLDQYGNAAQDAYVYPPAGGFVIAPDGRPIKTAQTLLPGYRLDRFGFPGGAYLSPLGTPFSSRALPPSNLNTPANAPLANYHTYCVLKPFTVDSGPIAPWFAQPGMGTQFKLESKYLPQAGTQLSVTWLVAHGFLVEENIAAPNVNPCAPKTGVTVC